LTSYRRPTRLSVQKADANALVNSKITINSAPIPKSSPAAFLFGTSVKAP
jgi:hypothetical protein